MKKIFTLGSALLMAMFSFADYAPARLTVTADGNTNMKIVIDENKFGSQTAFGSGMFDNIMPGYHSVKVYQVVTGRGFFGRQKEQYRLLYSTVVNVKPMFAVNITVNRNGRAFTDEQPIRGRFGKDDDWKKYDNKPGYDHGRDFDKNRHF